MNIWISLEYFILKISFAQLIHLATSYLIYLYVSLKANELFCYLLPRNYIKKPFFELQQNKLLTSTFSTDKKSGKVLLLVWRKFMTSLNIVTPSKHRFGLVRTWKKVWKSKNLCNQKYECGGTIISRTT